MTGEPLLAVDEIQGNILRGFNTAHVAIIGFQLTERTASAAARAWLGALPLAAIGSVAIFRHARRLLRASGEKADEVLVNVAFSARGCRALGLPVDGVKDKTFLCAMGEMAREFGDVRAGPDPLRHYRYGRGQDDTPDVVLIVGADNPDRLAEAAGTLEGVAVRNGFDRLFREDGAKLPGDTEHFGFRDGISQSAPRGRLSEAQDDYLSARRVVGQESDRLAAPGKPLIWPGQFVFGYRGQLDDDRPGLLVKAGEAWMANGSYLIFRRLNQDVAGFHAWCEAQANAMSGHTGLDVDATGFAARIVGRWPDGTPLALSPDGPDPSFSEDEDRINHFHYRNPAPELQVVRDGKPPRAVPGSSADTDGRASPRCAHIRKVNQRDRPHDKDSTLRLQMLRRGIPFGPLYREGEAPGIDRGLLFLAYQTSFKDQVLALTRDWMNQSSKPEGDAGHDMLVGQVGTGGRFATLPSPPGGSPFRTESLEHFVTGTGGAFLFSPAVSVVRALAAVT